MKNGIGRIMVGCWRSTYPSIHFFVSRSRSVVRGAVVCVVFVVCCVGVGVWSCWCCVLCVLVCWCGVVWSVVWSLFSLFSLFSSVFTSSSSSLISSRHQPLWKEPINQHGGQLRGIWMWSGARQVHSSRFSSSSSPLPPPFSPSPV